MPRMCGAVTITRSMLSWAFFGCSCKNVVLRRSGVFSHFFQSSSGNHIALNFSTSTWGGNSSNSFDCPRLMSTSSSPRSPSVELDMKTYFNETDIIKILKTVNEITDLDHLQKFGFSKKAIKILGANKRQKEQDGSGMVVSSIDDLVEIMGPTSSLRAFGNILERPNPNLKNPMFPIPREELVQQGTNVVSLVLHGSQISWCCIERNAKDNTFLVKQLQHYPLNLKNKQHFLTSLNEMVDLCGKIPQSNLFIIEEYSSTGGANPSMFSYYLNKTQRRSFLLGSLAARVDLSQIISIKTVAVARLFNMVVGTERVSGQHLVDNMITWKPLPSLIVPNRLKDEYEHQDVFIKEGFANSILLNLAYWRLTKQFTDHYS